MGQEKAKTPLERFIESLTSDEKALLDGYLKRERFEVLSLNFDKIIGAKNATKKADN
ncbi:MAG: hypothetical protein JRJ69_12645 [Deltaproteobacteria bacterium]|nr:hypothetical protein [Deltaproteobacteria bacterium]